MIFDEIVHNDDGSFILDGVLVSSGAKHQEIIDYITGSEASNVSPRDIRDSALMSLTHDFGGGRIIQTRPQDEQNVKAAIDLMTALNLPSIDWVMLDNIKHPVTVEELQSALSAGRLAAMQIWADYEP